MAISPTAIERGFSIYMIAWRGLGHLKQVSLNKLIPLFWEMPIIMHTKHRWEPTITFWRQGWGSNLLLYTQW